MITYAVEAADLVDGDTFREFGLDRASAQSSAASLSRKLSERVAYVVAFDGAGERVGHAVYIDGRRDRIDGNYLS